MEKTKKRRLQLLAASVFWLGVWQAAAMAIGQEVFLVSPVQALGALVLLLPPLCKHKLKRWQGGACLVLYILYLAAVLLLPLAGA